MRMIINIQTTAMGETMRTTRLATLIGLTAVLMMPMLTACGDSDDGDKTVFVFPSEPADGTSTGTEANPANVNGMNDVVGDGSQTGMNQSDDVAEYDGSTFWNPFIRRALIIFHEI